MKKYFLLFALIGVVLVSCKDDEEMTTYEVDITIEEPASNLTISVNDTFLVKVVFEREADEVIHHVKVQVLDENGDEVASLLEEHVHEAGTYTFETSIFFTSIPAGNYTIKAMSHDMEGNHADPAEVGLTVTN